MASTVQGQVGPQVLADGAEQALRQGRSAEVVVTELHGKYYETTYRGNVFHAATPAAGVALVAAGTAAGVALYNPAGSGKNLVLVRVTFGIVSGTYVAGSIMHGANVNPNAAATTGTALTPVNGMLGLAANPVGKPLGTATLPVAQTPLRPFANKTATPPFGILSDDIDGAIIITQGTTWSLYVIGADTSPLEQVGMTWEEVAV